MKRPFHNDINYFRGRDICVLLLLSFVTLVMNNGALPADIMESRNLVTAQEMVETGNYLVPTMNGVLRLEKPPLPTWGAAVVEMIVPGSLAAQRVLTGLMGFLLVLFVYLFVDELTHRHKQAFFVGLVLTTTYSVAFMSRNASWDIWCHALMMGGVYFYIRGVRRCGPQWKEMLFAGLFFGLSFLAKGPVSFYALLLPFLLSYHVAIRPLMRDKAMPLVAMALLALVVGSWWYGYLYFFQHDQVVRAAVQESGAWQNHSTRPWYYYKLFFVESGIWCVLWLISIAYGLFNHRMKRDLSASLGVGWTIFALILLSLVPEKKTRYLLPMMVPCAINVGSYLYFLYQYRTNRRRDRRILRGGESIVIALLVGLPVGLYLIVVRQGQMTIPFWLLVSAAFLFAAAYLYSSLRGRQIDIERLITCHVGAMALLTGMCLLPASHVFINRNLNSIDALRDNVAVTGLSFFAPQGEAVRMETVYAAGKRILPLNVDDSITMARAVPCVVITSRPISSHPALQRYRLSLVGRYDNNWKQPESRSYNRDLCKEVWKVE